MAVSDELCFLRATRKNPGRRPPGPPPGQAEKPDILRFCSVTHRDQQKTELAAKGIGRQDDGRHTGTHGGAPDKEAQMGMGGARC